MPCSTRGSAMTSRPTDRDPSAPPEDFPTERLAPSRGQPGAAAVPAEREFTVRSRSQTEIIVRRFLHHRLAVISLGLFIAIVLLAFIGGHFWHYKYNVYTDDLSASPSLKHPF